MSKITQSARGKPCQMRLECVCNRNDETTVFAHFRMHGLGGGTGIKPYDLFGAYLCSACHDAADNRDRRGHTKEYVRIRFAEAVFRTQKILVDDEIVKY